MFLLFAFRALTRNLEIDVLDEMLAERGSARLLNVQKHHDVRPVKVELKILGQDGVKVDHVVGRPHQVQIVFDEREIHIARPETNVLFLGRRWNLIVEAKLFRASVKEANRAENGEDGH